MITEKQKHKMLECLDLENFCEDIDCDDCPLKPEGSRCPRYILSNKVADIEAKPEKKLCPTCGHELNKEIK